MTTAIQVGEIPIFQLSLMDLRAAKAGKTWRFGHARGTSAGRWRRVLIWIKTAAAAASYVACSAWSRLSRACGSPNRENAPASPEALPDLRAGNAFEPQ